MWLWQNLGKIWAKNRKKLKKGLGDIA